MRRISWFAIMIAVAALAVLYALRVAERAATAVVPSLLPRDTIAVAHIPDFNGMIRDWHRSDIYQIYREPAVQEFLQKPANQIPKGRTFSTTIAEIQELNPQDSFVALTSAADNKPKLVGGFRFRASQNDAKRIIEKWRTAINPRAKYETLTYQQHQIDLYREGVFSLALVQDRDWFFASNDVDELKLVLDRADGRMKDRQALLTADESFQEARDAMPSKYALLFYLQPKTFADKINSVRAALAAPGATNRPTLIEQIRSVCATTRFENGKMHDVIFAGMPKQDEGAPLTRSSLALATRATFLYAASLIDLSKQSALLSSSPGMSFLGSAWQKITNALTASGITWDDWQAAFGAEAGLVADWAEGYHWPSAVVACGVKDAARAKRIISAVSRGLDEDAVWEESDRDGVHYWSMRTKASLIPISPVLGLSSQICVVGLDNASVETAIQRHDHPTFEFSNSETYKRAAAEVPEPTRFFAYFDLGLLYTRLDAALRPMLLMSAAFVPAVGNYVDATKLPPPEVITGHLSPIVSSQRYADNGYVAESVGPITLNQTGIGVAVLATLGTMAYQRGAAGLFNPLGIPAPSVTPSASPGSTGKSHRGSQPALPKPTDTP